MSFCVKTFPVLIETTARWNGLMRQTLGIFSVAQQRQWVGPEMEMPPAALGELVPACVSSGP